MKNGTYDSLYSYASKNCLGVHPKINWYAIAKFNFTRTIGALDKTVTVIWQFLSGGEILQKSRFTTIFAVIDLLVI